MKKTLNETPAITVYERHERPMGDYILVSDVQKRIAFQRELIKNGLSDSKIKNMMLRYGVDLLLGLNLWITDAWGDIEEEK